jgi:hypothetical protein
VGRRARLRREYASLYPGVASGTWMGAGRMAETVRYSSRQAWLRERLGHRLLPETHFEFRGGRPRRGVLVRTRATDRVWRVPSLRQRLIRAMRRFVTRHLMTDDPYERAKDSEAERRRYEAAQRPRREDP